MAVIDFPNPATQTPVNTFSPTSTPSATANGVTYTWDGAKWVAQVAGGGGATDKIEEGNTSAEVIDTGSDGRFVVTTEGSERLRVDSSGRLGIGVSAPLRTLHVQGALNTPNTGYIRYSAAGYSDSFVWDVGRDNTDGGGNFKWDYKGSGSQTTYMTLDASGRLLVGTTTPFGTSSNESYYSYLQIRGNTYSSTLDGRISLGSSKISSTVTSGNDLGSLSFCDGSGGDYAIIKCQADGTGGSGDYPGRIMFLTTADGASSPTERMRIISNGAFTNCLGIYNDTTGAGANMVVNSSGSLQRATSSIKYKTDVENAEAQYSDALLQCRPVWYRSTCQSDNPAHSFWGFIAEEVAEIDPRLVHWKTTKPVVQENGSVEHVPCEPEPEGVAYERFVPHLLNLIKRQQQAIETLEAANTDLAARITALEGGN